MRILGYIMALAVTTSAAADESFKIELGHDTTRITSPLKPDGTPDYLKYINDKAKEGVTKENNAARLWFQIYGPSTISDKTRDRMCRELEIELPANGRYWSKYPKSDQDDPTWTRVASAPWLAKEYPEVAAWLKENKDLLDRAVEASKLPKFYVPSLCERETLLLGVMIPSLETAVNIAVALQVRAMLATSEKRLDEAWIDIETLHRTGRQYMQHQTPLGRLVGLAHAALAIDCARDVINYGIQTQEQLNYFKEKYEALKIELLCVNAVDELERFTVLEIVISFKHKNKQLLDSPLREIFQDTVFSECLTNPMYLSRFSQADLSVVLRAMNARMDGVIRAAHEMDHVKRAQWVAVLDDQLEQSKQRIKTFNGDSTDWASHVAITLVPEIEWVGVFENNFRVYEELTKAVFDIQMHRAKHGEYPKELPAQRMDFYSGKPFIYKRTPDGYLLYSAGENMKDDGGEHNSDTSRKGGPDDLAVRVPEKS